LEAQAEDLRERMIGRSPAMREIYKTIGRVADSEASVLITGETGTGKELTANLIHQFSSRRNGPPMVKVNCAALPETLIESELFGHEKGAFTGAVTQRKGRFELASKSTIFLDEVGEISLGVQKKLLRVLQEGEIERVGGSTPIKVDVRVIAATNRDLLKEVEANRFREDLYYRLNVFPIDVPPLRERLEDIPLFAHFFLQKLNETEEKKVENIEADFIEALQQYEWPGNVRELRNVLQRANVMSTGPEITDQWLPRDPAQVAAAAAAVAPSPSPAATINAFGAPAHAGNGPMLEVAVGTPLAAVEKQVILATLQHYGHHKERTAAALGVSLKTLYNRLKEYGL